VEIGRRVCVTLSVVDSVCLLCFFFQAEDGIRDWSVTGVQTCALPIWPKPWRFPAVWLGEGAGVDRSSVSSSARARASGDGSVSRSGERRVGKECRARWGTGDLRKKKDERWGDDGSGGEGSQSGGMEAR